MRGFEGKPGMKMNLFYSQLNKMERKFVMGSFSVQISKLAQKPVIVVLRSNVALSVLRGAVHE